MLQMGVHTHLITSRAAIPLMLRTAPSHGFGGLVVEMTDGTSQANGEFRRNVGFYYDLVKANVERIVIGLTGRAGKPARHSGRRDPGLAALGTDAGELRRHRGQLAPRLRQDAGIRDLRVAHLCGKRRRPRSPGRATPTAGLARSSPLASSPTPMASPTPTEAD